MTDDFSVRLERRITTIERDMVAAAEALRMQAIEYERRLGTLNESREYEREAILRMVPRGEYEVSQHELNSWRRTVDGRLSTDSGQRTGAYATLALLLAVIGSIGSVISIIVAMNN